MHWKRGAPESGRRWLAKVEEPWSKPIEGNRFKRRVARNAPGRWILSRIQLCPGDITANVIIAGYRVSQSCLAPWPRDSQLPSRVVRNNAGSGCNLIPSRGRPPLIGVRAIASEKLLLGILTILVVTRTAARIKTHSNAPQRLIISSFEFSQVRAAVRPTERRNLELERFAEKPRVILKL